MFVNKYLPYIEIYTSFFNCYMEVSGKIYIGIQRELDIQSHLKTTLIKNIGFLK